MEGILRKKDKKMSFREGGWHCQSRNFLARANPLIMTKVPLLHFDQFLPMFSDSNQVSTRSSSGVRGQCIQSGSIGVEPDDVITKKYLKLKYFM